MKYLLLIILFTSCSSKSKISHIVKQATEKRVPSAVHNVCTGMCAVMTVNAYHRSDSLGIVGIDYYWGIRSYSEIVRDHIKLQKRIDTSNQSVAGEELQFKDSLTAMNAYHNFWYRRLRPQQIADSIFKCQHTYQ